MAHSAPTHPVDLARPLDGFSQCHAEILGQLQSFASLPTLVVLAEQSRAVAATTLALFEDTVLTHHADEERDLFAAVSQSARPGQEHEHVQALVRQLTEQHRLIEARWKALRRGVKSAASGQPAALEAGEVAEFVQIYTTHAGLEEREFLPLAQEILGRDSNHMAALGISLHLRHVPIPVGHI